MTPNQMHRRAMDLAERAIVAKRKSLDLFRQAFALEREAAMASLDAPEPTRSVLLRSAAMLAMDCGEQQQAPMLLALALEKRRSRNDDAS